VQKKTNLMDVFRMSWGICQELLDMFDIILERCELSAYMTIFNHIRHFI